MKKHTEFVCAAAIAALFCITSCDSHGASDGITLSVWESAGGAGSFISKAGEMYTKEHPNVRIRYVNVELSDAATQIALDGPAGIGPDLFAASHDKQGELLRGHHIYEIPDDDAFAHISPMCRTAMSHENVWRGFPLEAETYVLFYNKDLLGSRSVPKTWDEVVSFSTAFNAQNPGKYGFMMDVGNSYYSLLFSSLNDHHVFTNETFAALSLDAPCAVNGMKYFQSLRRILDIPAADITTAVCDGAFAGGKSALYITGLWNIKPFKNAGIDFGTAPLPSMPGKKTPSSGFSGVRTLFVSSYSRHIKEAVDFGKFLMTPAMQQLRFECTGSVPAGMKIEKEKYPYLVAFQEQLQYSFPMPATSRMNEFWGTMNIASSNIWDGADVQKELSSCCRVYSGR